MLLSPSTAHRFSAHVAPQDAAPRAIVPTGYEALQAHPDYAPYFNTTLIRESDEASLRDYFFKCPNVDQDKCMVVTIKKGDPSTFALTTDGVAACLVICARGKNPAGETVLYMSHESIDIGHKSIARALKVMCLQNWCDPTDVSIYILGGEASEVDAQGHAIVQTASGSDEGDEADEGDEGDAPDDPLHYRETLEALIEFPQVKAVRFPIMPFSGDREPLATAVVFTETDVLYCRSNSMPRDGYRQFGKGDEVPVDEADLHAITDFNRAAVHQALLVKLRQSYHASAAEPQPASQGDALSKDVDAMET